MVMFFFFFLTHGDDLSVDPQGFAQLSLWLGNKPLSNLVREHMAAKVEAFYTELQE